ncbi:unnamed protein product [Prorocentrum cordatum]|uniref:Amine oxidase domain-containing protein n=1 Tax=Prorocentrum cordatum TaxID=2364126 RepID=A0ABN9UVX3_9DINO|nr:unnamed protein product [Polarella glacialis]
MDSWTVPRFPPIPPDAAKDFQGKIVIVGAGVAGLFAANTLKFLGIEDFIVLEAGETFGGRLKSAFDFHEDVPLELGAEWIHASNGDVVKDMLVFPVDEGLEASEFIKYQPKWFFGSSRSRVLGCLYQETKWKRTTWLQWLERYVYRHVQDKVQFNAVVKEVAYGEDNGVRLLMEDGAELWAAKVICTIPLSILKLDAVKFDPALPMQMRKAIDSVGMLPGFRVLLAMKEKFYPDVTIDGGRFDLLKNQDQVCAVYDALYGKELSDKQNVLAVVAIGDKYCKDLIHLDDESLAKAALGIVDRLFKGQGTLNYIKHRVQNWSLEPYVLGAYSVGGASHERKELGKTINGRMLFAGEHTCVNFHSLVPGAALEGRRAAVEAVSGRIMS